MFLTDGVYSVFSASNMPEAFDLPLYNGDDEAEAVVKFLESEATSPVLSLQRSDIDIKEMAKKLKNLKAQNAKK